MATATTSNPKTLKLEKRANLRPYEGVILVHPDASEDEQKALFRKNKSIIEEQFGGELRSLDSWGRRSLSNMIAKNKKAIYFHAVFSADPQAIAEIERTMRINDRVLRFMHTRLDDGKDLNAHIEGFKQALADSAARERDREAKFQARRAAQGSRGPRRDDREGGDRGRRDDRGSRDDGDDGDEG